MPPGLQEINGWSSLEQLYFQVLVFEAQSIHFIQWPGQETSPEHENIHSWAASEQESRKSV